MSDDSRNIKAPSSSPRRVDVIVVGAGFGGMYAIYKFREMGLNVQGFEAGGDVGGVWYWNRYPGARVDLPSIDYSYGFSREIEQEWNWSEYFAAQPELLAYIDFVAKRLDLRKHFKFSTRVTRAVWDEARALWTVTTDQGDTVEAPFCVMATGPLSIPKDPEIPGIERFKGELYRAGKWPQHPVSYAGKRVGVLGTGSSGIQIVQAVGPQCGELFVLQRTPSFTMPMRNVKLDAGVHGRGQAPLRRPARGGAQQPRRRCAARQHARLLQRATRPASHAAR